MCNTFRGKKIKHHEEEGICGHHLGDLRGMGRIKPQAWEWAGQAEAAVLIVWSFPRKNEESGK